MQSKMKSEEIKKLAIFSARKEEPNINILEREDLRWKEEPMMVIDRSNIHTKSSRQPQLVTF